MTQFRRELVRDCSAPVFILPLYILLVVWVVWLSLRQYLLSSAIQLTAEQPGMLYQRSKNLTHVDVSSNFTWKQSIHSSRKFHVLGWTLGWRHSELGSLTGRLHSSLSTISPGISWKLRVEGDKEVELHSFGYSFSL